MTFKNLGIQNGYRIIQFVIADSDIIKKGKEISISGLCKYCPTYDTVGLNGLQFICKPDNTRFFGDYIKIYGYKKDRHFNVSLNLQKYGLIYSYADDGSCIIQQIDINYPFLVSI